MRFVRVSTKSCATAMSDTLDGAVAETGKLNVSLLEPPRTNGDGTSVVGTTTLADLTGVTAVLVFERVAI